ncbi:serine/threonine-protein kinase [Tateyamaria sp. Alg231-49]|uniref:serine/threonine-protein kinase n=1 Tax=Tateyamaria sp. Alg231-49 TaxID=1922219 RepID=UPI000D55AD48|nr:serine/threonine-protein kinase [Tateyamaria sp. Alg231-49]
MTEVTILAPNGGRRFIGKYMVESVLGEGAMGVVYAGVDPDIQRPVAIKTIHGHLLGTSAGDDLLERFSREARAAGRVLHANLVTIFDFLLEDGVPYLVMERVRSVTLKDHCKASSLLSLDDIHSILKQMLAGLTAIHAAGIVHRDMKPANVMLAEDDTVKLTDFGIAQLTSMEATNAGMIGTPSYMSPEQMMGHPVDARADIYATGVMLYELLTGRKPYPGGGMEAMFNAVQNETPVPPSTLVPELPPTLDKVVMKAMQIDADKRFSDAAQMRAAIDAALSGADPTTMIRVMPQVPTSGSEATSGTMLTQLSGQTLREVEQHLTSSMGPMGKIIARRVAGSARNAEEMIDAVLQDIPTQAEKDALRLKIQSALKTGGSVSSAESVSSAVSSTLPPERVAALVKLLTPHLGPIAPVLAKRHAKTAATLAALADQLAEQIGDPDERRSFLNAAAPIVR